MVSFRSSRVLFYPKGLTAFQLVSAIVLLNVALITFTPSAFAQGSAITKSFDFRNGVLGWQADFARYNPISFHPDDPYPPKAEIRNLPPELGASGTGFYLQANNHSDAIVMFLKRRLGSADGIVAGQTYQAIFTVTFASAAQSGCVGAGGSPGDGVSLLDGISPAEPLTLVETRTRFNDIGLNINIGKDGLGASASGSIANGIPCGSAPPNYVSLQQTHQHTSLVNASSKGDLWLFVGTASGFEGPTGIYYQRIDVNLTPVSPPPAAVIMANQASGRAAALDSQALMREPFRVFSEQNFFSLDQRTRINLFAYNLQLKAGEEQSVITVEAEDSQHKVYNLPVEAVNEIPNFNWISQVTVKLPDELQGIGDVLVRVKLRGVASNNLPIQIN